MLIALEGKGILKEFQNFENIVAKYSEAFEGTEGIKTLNDSVAFLAKSENWKDVNMNSDELKKQLAAGSIAVKNWVNKTLADDEKIEIIQRDSKGKESIKTVNKQILLNLLEEAGDNADRLALLKSIGVKVKAQSDLQDKRTEALILQLNLQKAQILAQKESVKAQFDIKSKYFEQSNLLDSQQKILGGLITEEHKVRIEYNKNLSKASEAYALGAQAALDAQRIGILKDISQDKKIEQALKQELFKSDIGKGKKYSAAGEVATADLTNKLATMDAKELLKILENLNISGDAANKIIENRTLLYENAIDKLQKQKTLSDGQSEAQKTLNEKIAQQKDLMVDVNREMQNYIRGLDNAAQSRAIASEITAARFGARPQTQGAIFAEQGRLTEERKKNIKTEYAKSATSQLKSLADTLGLDEKQRKQIIQSPDRLKGMSAKAIGSMEAELAGLGDMDKLRDKAFTEGLSQEETDLLSRAYELEQSIASAKSETAKKSEDIRKILKGELKITKEKLSKEDELLKIRKDEYARRTGPGAFKEGIKDAGIDMEKRVAMMDYELGNNIPMKFADGLAQAMQATLNQTENLGDALMGIASNFLQAIQSALLQKAAYQIVGGVGASTGLFSKGGGVRNYSRGGGVPAMVTNGEYVMSGDAVSKYGGAFMHSLNAGGKIPGFSNGGAVPGSAVSAGFGGGKHVVSERAYQSKPMSGYFYSGQAGSVALQEDESALMGVLAAEEKKRQEALAKKAKRRALLQQVIGTVASVGINYAMQGINLGGAGADSTPLSGDQGGGATITPVSEGGSGVMRHALDLDDATLARFNMSGLSGRLKGPRRFGVNNNYLGGKINKYASGGHISGKSGIDQIPAMLSEGEYVIRASSARQLGKPMLDMINAGKFNEGGPVTPMQESSDSGISGGNTNNINISINMERGKSSEEKSSDSDVGTNPAEKSEEQQNSSQLAERIKAQVVSVIVEEQRPGGLLSGKS
jgi:hypothetical protein